MSKRTSAKGDKSKFKRAFKKFNLVNGQLINKGNRLVIRDEQGRRDIFHDVHQGLGDNADAVGLSSHLRRTSTYQKITSCFYWYMIVTDVADYVKVCTKCQRHLARRN